MTYTTVDGESKSVVRQLPKDKPIYIPSAGWLNPSPITSVYKVDMADGQLIKLAELVSKPDAFNFPAVSTLGLSPDGSRLYFEKCERSNEVWVSERNTLFAIDTKSGEVTNIASLNNRGMEFSGWDWHDDSGVNLAFVAAEKFENALPPVEVK